MAYLYIVRHGQSGGNVRGGFAGRSDSPLSELGKKQARMTADFLRDAHIDAVLSSPLSRARDTAAPIAADRGLPVILRDDILEMNFGDWENLTAEEVDARFPGGYDIWLREIHNTVCPNGETMRECFARAKRAIHEIAEEYAGKDVCIVTHGGFLKALVCYLHGLPIEKMETVFWANNASVTKVAVEDGGFRILYENQSDHMGDCVTTVSPRLLAHYRTVSGE